MNAPAGTAAIVGAVVLSCAASPPPPPERAKEPSLFDCSVVSHFDDRSSLDKKLGELHSRERADLIIIAASVFRCPCPSQPGGPATGGALRNPGPSGPATLPAEGQRPGFGSASSAVQCRNAETPLGYEVRARQRTVEVYDGTQLVILPTVK